MTQSLLARGSALAVGKEQCRILGESTPRLKTLPRFSAKLAEARLLPLRSTGIEILQINLGKMCNQTCKHCHVDAGPDRQEIMTRQTLEHCLQVLDQTAIPLVDLTGGAPEMNPEFRWLVAELSHRGKKIINRCNLTILMAHEKYRDLPAFFAEHKIKVVSSLPYFQKGFTDRQRGDGVFDKSIRALKLLNDAGYGRAGTGLELDLVYNPNGAFLPANQAQLEADYKRELAQQFGIEFDSLFTITNMPISRFLDYLQASGNLEDYMEKLVAAYNPAAAENVMCRNTLSVGWDGQLYDCDFNQMLEIGIKDHGHGQATIQNFDLASLQERVIAVDQHCYGCTAGTGSSCGGALS